VDTPGAGDGLTESEVGDLRRRIADLEQGKAELERAQLLLQKSEEGEHRFREQLEALAEITNQLTQTESIDGLCRKAVELGRDRLGFDRIGIWFRTDEPDVVMGSFGVDKDGAICDERGRQTRIKPDTPEWRILLSKEPLTLVGEEPLVDPRGETVGHGSQIFAGLWDGEKVIGHISADNRVHNAPLLSQQCELLRMFALHIGSLCARKRIEMEREKLIQELRSALARIKTLRGLIPICSNCKKIRDDQGFWQAMEAYVRKHSEADFSHSLCPECTRELYPDYASGPEKTND
jgi:GAF domain